MSNDSAGLDGARVSAKACPFCRSADLEVETNPANTASAVRCRSCGARGPLTPGPFLAARDTAINHWNEAPR